MAWEGVSDKALFETLAAATAARAIAKHIALAVAAENVLCAARIDFSVPVERLPSRSELTLMAQSVR